MKSGYGRVTEGVTFPDVHITLPHHTNNNTHMPHFSQPIPALVKHTVLPKAPVCFSSGLNASAMIHRVFTTQNDVQAENVSFQVNGCNLSMNDAYS